METISLNIRNVIFNTIQREDQELLNLHNKGIFFLPELAITYLIGKELVQNSELVFGCKVLQWYTEYGLGLRSPIDLIIILENEKKYLFEFKTRQKSKSYIKDINKLSEFDSDVYEKFFGAFIDCPVKRFPDVKRVQAVENTCVGLIEPIREEDTFKSFRSMDHYPVRQVMCVFGFWKVR